MSDLVERLREWAGDVDVAMMEAGWVLVPRYAAEAFAAGDPHANVYEARLALSSALAAAPSLGGDDARDLLREAADAIARLREDVSALRGVAGRDFYSFSAREVTEWQAETERLRAANKALAEAAGPLSGWLKERDAFPEMSWRTWCEYSSPPEKAVRALSRAVEAAAPSLTGGDDARDC